MLTSIVLLHFCNIEGQVCFAICQHNSIGIINVIVMLLCELYTFVSSYLRAAPPSEACVN